MENIDLVKVIEDGLGKDRLRKLQKNSDNYQQFWIGVLKATKRVDWSKDFIGFLISNGYGEIRNAYRAEYTKTKYRVCLKCHKIYNYRTLACPCCGEELITEQKIFPYIDDIDSPVIENIDEKIDFERFVNTLQGQEAYIGKRWIIDRVDLYYNNHLKQLSKEMKLSIPRICQIKRKIRDKFKIWVEN